MRTENKITLLLLVLAVVCVAGVVYAGLSFKPKIATGTISKTYIANDGSKSYSDYFIVLDNGITYEVNQEDWGIANIGDFVELSSFYSGGWKILQNEDETQ